MKSNSLRTFQLEHTPNPQPTVYEGIPFIWGFGDVWGMLQGYVGVPLEIGFPSKKRIDYLPTLTGKRMEYLPIVARKPIDYLPTESRVQGVGNLIYHVE